MFFISTSVSTARSRSVTAVSSASCGGSQGGAPASSRRRLMPAGAPRRKSTSSGRTTRSPGTSMIQSRCRRTAMTRIPHTTGSSRSLSDRCAICDPSEIEHAVAHLFGGGKVGQELLGDTEAIGDDPGDVDSVVADALDGRDHLEHGRHAVGLLGPPHRQDRHAHACRGRARSSPSRAPVPLRPSRDHRSTARRRQGRPSGPRCPWPRPTWCGDFWVCRPSAVTPKSSGVGHVIPTVTMPRMRAKAPTRSREDATMGMPYVSGSSRNRTAEMVP